MLSLKIPSIMINLACKLGRIHQLRDVSLDWSVNAFPTFPKRTAGDKAFPRVGADWHLWLVAQIQRGHVKRCCWPSCPSHSLSPFLSFYLTSFFPSLWLVSTCEYTCMHTWRPEEDFRWHPALSFSY